MYLRSVEFKTPGPETLTTRLAHIGTVFALVTMYYDFLFIQMYLCMYVIIDMVNGTILGSCA
jgi:hypothetical protein